MLKDETDERSQAHANIHDYIPEPPQPHVELRAVLEYECGFYAYTIHGARKAAENDEKTIDNLDGEEERHRHDDQVRQATRATLSKRG